ncbi:peptidase, partial [Vibrio sp. D173a]|nr:peptidase [Vibrio sp. D173a]
GPLTRSEAESQGVTSTSSNFDDNGFDVATFTLAAAEDSCQNKGRLPTSDELKALAIYNGGPDVYDGWPVDLPYWAKNDAFGQLIDLRSGLPEPAFSNLGYYVTCMNDAGLVVVDAESQLEAVADNADQAVVAVKLTRDDRPVEGEWLEASTPNRTNVTFDDTTLSTNDKGVAKFALKTWEAGQVPVNIKYNGETLLTQNVKFIGDEATADLELEVIKTGVTYEDPGGNIVEATMMDANNNPVVGRPVTFTTSEDESVERIGATVTNTQGKQRVGYVWKDSSTTDASRTVTVTASYTPQSTGTRLFDTDEITFVSPNPPDPTDPTDVPTPPTCGVGINDDDKSNATGYCLKVADDADGNWFTSTPSWEVVERLGYLPEGMDVLESSGVERDELFGGLFTEDGTGGPARGQFAAFSQGDGRNSASQIPLDHPGGVGSDFDRWCQKLNELEFRGVTNWDRPTLDELRGLFRHHGNVWTNLGWPLGYGYWSKTEGTKPYVDRGFWWIDLRDGRNDIVSYPAGYYASCISKNH